MKKKVFKFNADNKNVNVATQFCLGTISNRLVLLSLVKYHENGICVIFQ